MIGKRIKLARGPATALLVAVAVAGLGGWALAETGTLSGSSSPTTTAGEGSPGASTDNAAVAVNNQDGRTVVALAIKIVQTDAEVVDPVNAAVAVASCQDCQTVAIALEGVLVVGSPESFSPTNIALAINSGCTNCETLAAAYQKVVQNDGRVRITGAGRRQIADIRTDLLSLRNSGLDITEIMRRVEDAAARFVAVLENEVVPLGPPATTTVAPPTTAAPVESTTTTTTEAPPTTEAPTTTVP